LTLLTCCLALWGLGWTGAAGAASGPGLSPVLEAWEREARADPAKVVAELQQGLKNPPTQPAEHLEWLRLAGQLEATLEQPEAVQTVLGHLAALGVSARLPSLQADARATGNCLRADLLRRTGSNSLALRLQDGALDDLATGQSASVRLYCLGVFADVNERLGNFPRAIELWQRALQEVEPWVGRWQRAWTRNQMSGALQRAGQDDLGMQRNQEAQQLAEEDQDWLTLASVMTVRSILLTGKNRANEELLALTLALDYARRAKAPREQALYLANLSDFYLQAGDFAKALSIAREAVPLADRLGYANAQRLATFNASLALVATGRKDQGMRLIQPELDRLKSVDDVAQLSDYLKDLGRYMEVGGYEADALKVYRELRQLSSEKFRRDQQRTILEMQEGFDAERRRHEKQLLTDDNQLQEEALRQADLQWRQWALATAVGLVSLGLLYNVYRKVRRTQQRLHQNNERLREQSELDPLTGLANRRHFQRLTQGPGAPPTASGSLFLLDLDHFKQINDRHGHAGGDAVLVETGRRLRAVVRSGDTVLRWGGEEFLIMTSGRDPDQADQLAQRLLEVLASSPVAFGEHHVDISASIGHAEFPLQPYLLDVPWHLAVDLVDAAMYIAKTQGRNRAVGVKSLSAADLQSLQQLVPEMEAAWREGRVTLAQRTLADEQAVAA
jgi:diguanylate cyclase (GGDEF)-like protein